MVFLAVFFAVFFFAAVFLAVFFAVFFFAAVFLAVFFAVFFFAAVFLAVFFAVFFFAVVFLAVFFAVFFFTVAIFVSPPFHIRSGPVLRLRPAQTEFPHRPREPARCAHGFPLSTTLGPDRNSAMGRSFRLHQSR